MPEFRMLKYPLFDMSTILRGTVSIDMPNPQHGCEHGAVKVGMQGTVLTLWCLVDVSAPTTARIFHVAGTGHELPENLAYVGTAFDRQFVWHVFEIPT